MSGPGPLGAVPDRPRRGWWRWVGVVLGVLLLSAGAIVTIRAVTYVAKAQTVVADYFAALSRGDARTALSLGPAPTGDTHLLTARALAEQNRIAPIRSVHVLPPVGSGDQRTVPVRYRVGDGLDRNESIGVHRAGNGWALDRTASTVTVHVDRAQDRMTFAGAAIPTAPVRLFPGPLPIVFDTPALTVDERTATVPLATDVAITVGVTISAEGRGAIGAALDAAVRRCLSEPADPVCPFRPSSGRSVPGTLRGTVSVAPSAGPPSIGSDLDEDGRLTVTGEFSVVAQWTALDFENQPVAAKGTVRISYAAQLYVTDPTTLIWVVPT